MRRGLGSGGGDGSGIGWHVGGLNAELDADLEDDLLDADKLEDTEPNDDDPRAPLGDDAEAAWERLGAPESGPGRLRRGFLPPGPATALAGAQERSVSTWDEGGLGGAAGGAGDSPSPRGIRDTRLAELALRERWPMPDAVRVPMLERLVKIVSDPKASAREVTAAIKALLAASKINLDALGVALAADEHENLAERIERLEEQTAHGESGLGDAGPEA